MTLIQVIEKFEQYPKSLTNGAGHLSKRWGCNKDIIYEARKIARNKNKIEKEYSIKPEEVKVFKAYKKFISDLEDYSQVKNILVIADTHIPYEKEGYLEFCKEQYDTYNCDAVVHIGDLIDSHATSYHPNIPDAYSPGDELKYTKKKLQEWYKVFPNMKVVRGNHDERPYKLAAGIGIASHWMKSFTEVLGVPNWEYEESYTINGIVYTHGTGTSGVTAAYRRALNLGQNVVMGHLHSEASIIHHKLPEKTIWGMIVGCGVDETSYGMNYAKNFPKKSVISCGIILDTQPLIKIM